RFSSNCFYVPGNELVFMLKTSSDYAHSSEVGSYYGFKAQVVGYETPFGGNCKEANMNNNTNSNEVNKESMFQHVKLLIQNFENEIVYLFGLCINTLLNSSSANVIAGLVSKVEYPQSQEAWLKKFDTRTDIDFAHQIFTENQYILGKSFAFDQQSLSMKSILDFNFPISNVHSFLADFIKLKPESSGARLALWFQSESFISPNCCIVSTIQSVDSIC